MNIFKNIDNTKTINNEKNEKNISENIIKKIKENKNLYERISYLQLWWKTIYQIIKIQKYLRGFLYRIKLLKILERKENIVYGIIQLSKNIKKHFYKNIIKLIQDKIIQKKKYYFNIWNNLITKKNIIKKLKTFDKSKLIQKNKNGNITKINKTKNTKKLKSDSIRKRNIHNKEHNDENKTKNVVFDEKNVKKEQSLLISKKNGLESSRINTEKNIHNTTGIKNNSMEKRSKKNINFNSNNNINIGSNKKTCKFYKTSSNLLMNKSQNQIKNYKFHSKNNMNSFNKIYLSKKNTGVQKSKKIIKIRNKKIPPSLLDNNLNKFKSYNIESTRNKNKPNITKNPKAKKNTQLEYISTHENRFRCPKEIYSLNKNRRSLKKSSSITIEKLENSFQSKNNKLDNDKENKDINETNNNSIRAKSVESRHKKKFKSFVENSNTKNEIEKNEDNLEKNINTIELPKNEENKAIIKSKTKVMKKTKKKKNHNQNQKGILKNSNRVQNKFKHKIALEWLNAWKMKNVKKQIVNKLRSISKLTCKIKKYLYKHKGHLFLNTLRHIQKTKIIFNNFITYINISLKKLILRKLKENFYNNKEIEKEIEKNLDINNKNDVNIDNNSIDDNIKDNLNDNNENDKEKEEEKIIDISEKKINIIEISTYKDTKINSKIKNNKIIIESKIKLQKLILIKKRITEQIIKQKYFKKWKVLLFKYEPAINPGYHNIKEFYLNYKTKVKIEKDTENQHQRINSSYHRKRVKYQPNYILDSSFKEEKLYNKKIVNYTNYTKYNNTNNNNNNINNITTINKEYLNKSQPEINYYNNFKNLDEYNNYNYDYQDNYYPSNLITSSQYDDNNNKNNNKISINYNLCSNSPFKNGIYKKKRVINTKNSNINKNINNMSCVLGDVNKSNFELNNTIENEKEFLNNSMVMRRRIKNNNDVYFPKHVSPNLVENEPDYEVSNLYIREQPEFYSKTKNENNINAYKKMNIRYQKMYYENDLNSEHRQVNFGILEEQTNEGTN